MFSGQECLFPDKRCQKEMDVDKAPGVPMAMHRKRKLDSVRNRLVDTLAEDPIGDGSSVCVRHTHGVARQVVDALDRGELAGLLDTLGQVDASHKVILKPRQEGLKGAAAESNQAVTIIRTRIINLPIPAGDISLSPFLKLAHNHSLQVRL